MSVTVTLCPICNKNFTEGEICDRCIIKNQRERERELKRQEREYRRQKNGVQKSLSHT